MANEREPGEGVRPNNLAPMNKIYLPNYNLNTTLLGGQSFSWEEIDKYFYGFTQDMVIKLKREKDFLYWQTYPQKDNFDYLATYLQTNYDFETKIKLINKDKHINLAIEQNRGLRLLKQDFELTTLFFILSAFKNIKGIRHSVKLLSKQLGEKVLVDNKEFYLFPKTDTIANTSEQELKKSSIGYRAKYLKLTSEILLKENISRSIINMDETEARKLLKSFPGIGDKVADCVLTFALGFSTTTPLDIWAKRVLTNLYGLDPKMTYLEMREWLNNYFEGNSALAGQYLFEYIRKQGRSVLKN